MGRDSLHIELLNTPASFEKFATLPFDVYNRREAWWPPDVQNEVELLSGKSPIASYLEIAPWWARRKDKVVARVTAIVNRRYNDHWGERLGHLIHFEAMPDEQDAVSAMLDRASEWFAERNI